MLKHRFIRAPMRGSILDDDSNLMHYQGGVGSSSSAQPYLRPRGPDNDYEEVDSISGEDTSEESLSCRLRSEPDLRLPGSSSSNLHCYDEIDDALFNDSAAGQETIISPYCVGPVGPPRSRRFGSTASCISQDSGAFCDESGPPPPLPRKPGSRRTYANIFEASPPPLPPRKSTRAPPLPPARTSPLTMNHINLPGLNPVGRKVLSQVMNREESSKKARRRRTLHSLESNKENLHLSSSPSSSSAVSTKKKFKIFGSKTPLSVPNSEDASGSSPAPSPRRRKIFRRSLINTSLRKKKILDPSLSTPVSQRRRRASLMFGGVKAQAAVAAEEKEEVIKSEEIIESSKDEDFSHCIRDALKHGLPIIPFQSNSSSDKRIPPLREPPVCCCHASSCHNNNNSSNNNNVKKSLENIVGEAKKEIEDEEKRLLSIMMKHADLLLTPRIIRAALKKSSKSSSSPSSDLSEEEISEYLEMSRIPSSGR